MPAKSDSEQLKQLGYTLHQLLLDGDLTASAQIAETFMPLLIERLSKRYSNLADPHLIDTAVEDALINYFDRPEQYNPAKASLGSYLRMSANGDLLNLLEQSKRHSTEIKFSEIVALDDTDAEHEVDIPDDFDLEALVLNQNSPVWQWLPKLVPDPIDQELVLLMMENIRETTTYADVLGISSYPASKQAALVKQNKDRLKKKLQRALKRSDLSDHD